MRRPAPRRRTISWLLAGGAMVSAVAGCNLALGLPDYEDAALQLCGCPGVPLAFTDCTTRVHDALADAKPKEREAWLSTFAAQECDTCKGELANIAVCLQTAPVCREKGEDCERLLDCCGAIYGTGYCYEGKCRVEAPSCKHAFDACETDDDCCGSEAGLGKCYAGDNGNICYEFCASPDTAQNCPGCCTHIEGTNLPKDDVCVDGAVAAASLEELTAGTATCQSACYLGVDEDCPAGTSCKRLSLGNGANLHYCTP